MNSIVLECRLTLRLSSRACRWVMSISMVQMGHSLDNTDDTTQHIETHCTNSKPSTRILRDRYSQLCVCECVCVSESDWESDLWPL